MSDDVDPPRLFDHPPDDLLGEALKQASADMPDAARVEAMLLRLPPGPGGPAGGGGGGGGPPAAPIPKVGPALATKILGAFSLAAAVAGVGYVAWSSHPSAPASSAPPSTPSALVASASGTPAPSIAVTPSAPSASASAVAPASSAPHVSIPAPASSTPLASELSILQEAQSSVGSNPAHALELTNEHARLYPNGQLGQEREAIRIHALMALGRTSEARAAEQAFEARNPGSALVPRLRDLVGVAP